MFPAGTTIRNLEGSTHGDASILKRHSVSSWIRLLEKHNPTLNRRDIRHCAAFSMGVCKIPRNKHSLCGAHAKLNDDPNSYIIPLCASHNSSLRAANLHMTSTREFPAFLLPVEAADRELIKRRAQTHFTALKSDLKELDADVEELFAEIARKMDELRL